MTVDWRKVPGRYIKDPRLGHRFGRNYPAGEISDPDWNIRWLGTDDLGFIYNESPVRDFALDDTKYKRIFLLGGSTLMGLGVESNSETISSNVERILRARISNARTVNCGVGAYMSWHELTYLALELILFKPNVVVIMDGWNDFLHSSLGSKGLAGEWIANTHRSLDDIVTIVQLHSGDISWGEFFQRKLSKIPLVREFQYRKKYAFQSGQWHEPDYRNWCIKPWAVDLYFNNIRSIIGVARAHGAQVLYLLQPQLLWNTRSPTSTEAALIEKLGTRMPPIPKLAPEWFALCKERLPKLQQEFDGAKDVGVIDASTWLDQDKETVYHDYNHYNARGQAILAQKIANIIEKM